MQIISLDQINLSSLIQHLQAGKTLVYPTETCYGLGCDAKQEAAVQKIFHIKNRQAGKSMLIVFPNVSMALQYIEWNETLQKLAEKYWPGALTVVGQAKTDAPLASGVRGEGDSVAFRISSHPLVQEIGLGLGRPLVSTSANMAGEDNPYDPAEILSRFAEEQYQPDLLIDAGILPHTAPSTIVKIHNGIVEVLRQGEVRVEV